MGAQHSSGAIVYRHSADSYVARNGENSFLLQFGKVGYSLTREELDLMAAMMSSTRKALESEAGDDPVLAWVGIAEVQRQDGWFYLVRFRNTYLCMCKRMLLVLIELCVGGGERAGCTARQAPAKQVDSDIVEMLQVIEKNR
jgi:hypothetical protein